jgi:hypothetical protein
MRAFTRASVVTLVARLGLAAAMVATVTAQSLGDIAKQEEARRKADKTPTKVLTNDSLRSVPTSPVSVPAPAAAAPPAASAPPGAPAAADAKAKPPVDRKAEEAAWRQRIQGARDSLQRSQMFAEALQSRINGLTADFTARDDPAQRAVVANDRQKALAELDRVKNDIVQQTKAIADIQEEARRGGVPPGWLR